MGDRFASNFDSLTQMGLENVSRETFDRLCLFHDLLLKWQRAYNLVSPTTLEDAWHRHILDSVQLMPFLPKTGLVLDLGTGAGFPGLVLAIAAAGGHELQFELVEANQKKAQFLSEVIRQTGASAKIHNRRIESLPPTGADIVTSRALADVGKLLEFTVFHGSASVVGLFLKGKTVNEELTRTAASWTFQSSVTPSRLPGGGVILQLSDISRGADQTPGQA